MHSLKQEGRRTAANPRPEALRPFQVNSPIETWPLSLHEMGIWFGSSLFLFLFFCSWARIPNFSSSEILPIIAHIAYASGGLVCNHRIPTSCRHRILMLQQRPNFTGKTNKELVERTMISSTALADTDARMKILR